MNVKFWQLIIAQMSNYIGHLGPVRTSEPKYVTDTLLAPCKRQTWAMDQSRHYSPPWVDGSLALWINWYINVAPRISYRTWELIVSACQCFSLIGQFRYKTRSLSLNCHYEYMVALLVAYWSLRGRSTTLVQDDFEREGDKRTTSPSFKSFASRHTPRVFLWRSYSRKWHQTLNTVSYR